MPSRYKNTPIKNRPDGKRVFKPTMYPKIPIRDSDVFIYPKFGDRLDNLAYKYYKDAGINNGNNLKNDGYRMYRERYFDLINLYETYNSFHTYREYMKTKLNKLNIEVAELFDVVKDNNTVTDEIRSLLTFD